jgi:hypothetical protein
VEPDPAELERRGDDAVPERPEILRQTKLDPCTRMELEEIVDRDHLEGSDRLSAPPVAADLGVRSKGDAGEPIGEDVRVTGASEPGPFDRVDACHPGE